MSHDDERRYIYFVSYWFTDERAMQGFGNCELFRFEPINSYQDVESIGKTIKDGAKHGEYHHITVLGWQLLQVQHRVFHGGWVKMTDE